MSRSPYKLDASEIVVGTQPESVIRFTVTHTKLTEILHEALNGSGLPAEKIINKLNKLIQVLSQVLEVENDRSAQSPFVSLSSKERENIINLIKDIREQPLSERSKWVMAAIVGVCSVPLYLEATKDADWYVKLSSIIANAIVCFYAGKASVDFLQYLWKEKKKFVGVFLLAFASFLPISVICFALSKHCLSYRLFEATATQAGGTVMYMLSITQLGSFGNFLYRDLGFYIRNVFGRALPEEKNDREKEALALRNRNNYLAALNQVDLKKLPLASGDFDSIISELQSMSPIVTNVAASAIRLMLQLTVFTALSLGTIPYTCDSEKAFRDLLGMSAWVAFSSAATLMFLQYALNFTGAASVVDSVWNVAEQFLLRCRLGNDLKLGGKCGVAATLILPFLAVLIAFFSGYTTGKFKQDSCPSSKLSWLMSPSWTSEFVMQSAAAFNAIYTAMAFRFFTLYVVEHFGSQQDRHYLKIQHDIKNNQTESQTVADTFRERTLSSVSMQTTGKEETAAVAASAAPLNYFSTAWQRVSLWAQSCCWNKGYSEVNTDDPDLSPQQHKHAASAVA